MSTDTRTRIAERNVAAAERMQEQGPLRRVFSRAGLATANMLDRLTGWGSNDRSVFGAASINGAIRGALYGGILAVGAACIFTSLFAVGGLLVAGAAAAGALYGGIHDGQKYLEKHIGTDKPRLSDYIARYSGAIGHSPVKITKGPKETLTRSGRDPELQKDVDAALAQGVQDSPGFAARINARRERILNLQEAPPR